MTRCRQVGDNAPNAHRASMVLLRVRIKGDPTADSVFDHPALRFKDTMRW
jgi:hypothetical protein